ncbi:uncharacterized protein [Cicer arietinum]|uniref:Uncharacterized protein LOC101497439 n=1 Tax=Cicer arietinum TaxID=3827 RepID=A0A1S2X9D0_CICAR|nr:uncharacterized protein LOC101497439 [Cicer arietinum]
MRSFFPFRAVCIVVLLLVTNTVTVVKCIPNRELDSMLSTLRARGYDLFCNAIVTSDLRIDLLSFDDANSNYTHSFTFFAPTDSSLFALDMTQTASSYTDTLRYHIIPRRLSLAELRLLPNGYTLPTLLSTRRVPVTRRTGSSVTTVGGVDLAFPGLFYGRHVAVHGLSGILTLRLNNPTSPAPAPVPPPVRSTDHRHFNPKIPHSPENQTILDSVPKSGSFNFTGNRGSRYPMETPGPAPGPAIVPETGGAPVHFPVNFSDAPFIAPVSPPREPESAISFPPEGYSDAEAPAPSGLEPMVQKNGRVSLMEMLEKYEALDGVTKCEIVAVGLKERISDDSIGHMQCYAAQAR